MLVAITGANGFLGRNLSSQLQMQGHAVRNLSHAKGSPNSLTVDYFSIPLIEKAIKDVDLLIHCSWAGVSNEQRSDQALQNENVLIARNMAASIDNTSVKRIIAIGSQDEFGDIAQPWSDVTPIFPTSAYGIAKGQVKKIFEEADLEFSWVRLFSIFGEGDLRNTIFLKVAKALKNNQELTLGSCENLWLNCHIDDVVAGLALIIDVGAKGAINLTPSRAPSLRSQIELLVEISGTSNNISFDSKVMSGRSMSASEGKTHELGWEPKVSLEEG
jgi:dTDP-6-deoxy-L-talose 4-dehydrogenase (NAD+)